MSKRICALCLEDIDRDKYKSHIEGVHGYTTLEVGGLLPVCKEPEPQQQLPKDDSNAN